MQFNDDRFWNEKALVLWKCDNEIPKNNNVGSSWGPVSGSKNAESITFGFFTMEQFDYWLRIINVHSGGHEIEF